MNVATSWALSGSPWMEWLKVSLPALSEHPKALYVSAINDPACKSSLDVARYETLTLFQFLFPERKLNVIAFYLSFLFALTE